MDRSLATVYGIAKSLIELSMQRNKIWFLKYKADKYETGPERLSEDQKRLVFSASMYPGESWSQHRDFSPKGVRDLSCLSFLKTLGPQSSNRRKVKLVFSSYCLLGKGAMPWVSTYPHPPTI